MPPITKFKKPLLQTTALLASSATDTAYANEPKKFSRLSSACSSSISSMENRNRSRTSVCENDAQHLYIIVMEKLRARTATGYANHAPPCISPFHLQDIDGWNRYYIKCNIRGPFCLSLPFPIEMEDIKKNKKREDALLRHPSMPAQGFPSISTRAAWELIFPHLSLF